MSQGAASGATAVPGGLDSGALGADSSQSFSAGGLLGFDVFSSPDTSGGTVGGIGTLDSFTMSHGSNSHQVALGADVGSASRSGNLDPSTSHGLTVSSLGMGAFGQSLGLHSTVEPLTGSGATGSAALEALGALGGSFADDARHPHADTTGSATQGEQPSEQDHDQVDELGSLWLSD
jgi:hypothetical protein